MHDEKYAQMRFGKAAGFGPLVLPYVQGENRRVVYTITEYDPLLDSSNMTITDWVRIADDIKVFYNFPIFLSRLPNNHINILSFASNRMNSMMDF